MVESDVAGLEVRRAAASDLVALVELRAEMFLAMGTPDVHGAQWRESARDWFSDRLEDARVRIVVIEVNARVVSTAMGMIRDAAPSPSNPSGRDILISNICTARGARRRGYAKVAFAEVLRWARSTGVSRAELLATGTGRGMYEAEGFTLTPYPAMRAHLTVPHNRSRLGPVH